MITICFTYFKSLTLANLAAALYSVCRQDLSRVEKIVVVDNDTVDEVQDIQDVIDEQKVFVPVRLLSFKHGDPVRTHSWSTNIAVRATTTPWVLFTRADYLLDFDVVKKFTAVVESKPADWNGFVTGNGCHLAADIVECERLEWRTVGPRIFRGIEFDYTCIDAGVWMARRAAFDNVGGLDEGLLAWGHAQTHFQWKLHNAGVECVRVPEVLFYHPKHEASRDMNLAHQQLRDQGIDITAMWKRHDGRRPYA